MSSSTFDHLANLTAVAQLQNQLVNDYEKSCFRTVGEALFE